MENKTVTFEQEEERREDTRPDPQQDPQTDLRPDPEPVLPPQDDYQRWKEARGVAAPSSGKVSKKPKRKLSRTAVVCIIAAAFLVLGAVVRYAKTHPTEAGGLGFGSDYIAVLSVEGEISEGASGTYDHQWLLDTVDSLMEDPFNKGIFLKVNTPGGSVYASDELYLKFKEYQSKTSRPIYA